MMSNVNVEQELKDYIKNWNSIEGIKPKNESIFISLFVGFLTHSDLEMTFDGEGSYFGKQNKKEAKERAEYERLKQKYERI